MSIRTLLGSNNKSWLNIKANTLDPITADINNGEILNFPSGSSMNLSSSTGSIGDTITKSGGNVVWGTTNYVGNNYQFQNDNTVFNTLSNVFVSVPNSQFTTSLLPAGNYLLLYSADLNATATAYVEAKVVDLDLVSDINLWSLPDGVPGSQRVTGFFYLAGVSGVKNFEFQIKTPSSVQVGSTNTIWALYRLS